MKKLLIIILCFVCFLIFVLIFLEHNKSTADNASPENLYKNDPTMDFLIYDDTAYVNASNIDWIKDIELTCDKSLGTIKRTKIKKNFRNFDATQLEVGSYVCSTVERKDIVLAMIGNKYVPYYKYVEGQYTVTLCYTLTRI